MKYIVKILTLQLFFHVTFLPTAFAVHKHLCEKEGDPDHVAACDYYTGLSLEDQAAMMSLADVVEKTKVPLVPLLPPDSENIKKPIVVLVDGFSFQGYEFFPTFHFVKTEGFETYFFRWKKFRSIKLNIRNFKKAVLSLSEKDSAREIIVFAYSGGGVTALRGFSDLQFENNLPSQVHLHTIATPVAGFAVPKHMGFLSIPFIGPTGAAIGNGLKHKLHDVTVKQCEEWITTNCKLDELACLIRGIYPEKLDPSPCGEENLHVMDDQTHFTALVTVIKSVLKK
jgi:hypothetical protein